MRIHQPPITLPKDSIVSVNRTFSMALGAEKQHFPNDIIDTVYPPPCLYWLEIRRSPRLNNCLQLEEHNPLNSDSLITENMLLPVTFCIHLCSSTAQVYLLLILFPISIPATPKYLHFDSLAS